MKLKKISGDVQVSLEDIVIKLNENWYSVRALIETKMFIVNKEKRPQNLTLNYAQEKLYKKICECLYNGVPCNFIILKARQLGFTTFISAFLFVMTFFRGYQESVIIANTIDNASKIFQKYRYYYDSAKEKGVPIPELQNKTGNQLYTKHTKSSIRIAPATSDAVRGTTITGFHGSEVAFWGNIDDIIAAAKSALPDTPLTFFFMESTANGQNDFKDYWDSACEDNSYIPMFFPWFENEEYKAFYNGFTLTPFESEMKEKYNLSNEQIAFFRNKYLGYKKNLQLTLQEYPFCPSDAFMTSGSGVFDNSIVAKRKDEVRNIKNHLGFFKYEIKTLGVDDWLMHTKAFTHSEAGHIKLFELPEKGVPYVIGVDMAVGLNNDSSVAQVIRNDTKKQVAIMSSNSIPPEKFSIDVVALGYFYNQALISPETAYGTTIINTLKKFGYRNIYIRQGTSESLSDNYMSLYGVRTTVITKPQMIDLMRQICSDSDYKNILDYGTLNEMESFVYEYSENSDKVKIKGSGHKHDDKVMALAIAYFSSGQQDSIVMVDTKEEESKLPFALQSDVVENEGSDEWESIYI